MAVEVYFAWGQSSASVAAGETVAVPVTADIAPSVDKLSALFSPYAAVDSATTSVVVIRGVSAGSITVPTGRDVAPQSMMDMTTYPSFTLTVTAPVDDDKFLNKRGLTHFWENIDDLKLDTDGTAYRTAAIPYGECDSTSTSTVFTATVPGITELRDGVCMLLKNGVVNSAAGFTININNLGAKPVYNNMAAATRETTLFGINYTILFIYDSDRVEGGCWVYYRGYYSDANSVGYQIRTNSSTLPALQTGYRFRLWLTSADGRHYVPINTATGTSTTSTKALNTTTPIDPFGTIVYNATNGTVNADASLPTGTQWTQFTLDLRYAKYPLATLTFPDPVYLQCTPQSTGGALINDIVQTLPTTEDGKIYIYLGTAYSATSMELKQNHPVYYFKDGQIRQWTNAAAGISSVAWGDITGTLSNQSDLNSALGAKANSADLAAVATSGSYNDLSNKPTIPAAQVNSDWSANSGVAQILNKPTLATVATSGDYDDLINKPAAITVDSALSWTSQNPVENQTIRNAIYVKNSSNDKEAGINIAFSDPTMTPYVHLGSKTSATKGINSVGIGNNAEASAIRSVAIGNSATASKREGVALGPNATAGQYSLSIGYYTETVPNYSTAVGPYAKVLTGATNATAIGYQSEASEAETVSVGKSTKKRRIVNVADGTTATDAATVGQIPTNTSDLTNDSGFIDEVSTITNARIDEIMGVS